MYAVIGQVKLVPDRRDEALKLLKERGEAMVAGLAGSRGGYWARPLDNDTQHSFWLFDTEENARAAAAIFGRGPPPGAPATFVSVEVCEVVGKATTEL
jgi:hypothetical protein